MWLTMVSIQCRASELRPIQKSVLKVWFGYKDSHLSFFDRWILSVKPAFLSTVVNGWKAIGSAGAGCQSSRLAWFCFRYDCGMFTALSSPLSPVFFTFITGRPCTNFSWMPAAGTPPPVCCTRISWHPASLILNMIDYSMKKPVFSAASG